MSRKARITSHNARINARISVDPCDQRTFFLNDEEWDDLVRTLNNPPKPNRALRDLMRSKPPWEKK